MSALPPAFLKRTPDRPLKGSLYWRHWGRSPAIVVSHNGPKNQNTWGSRGGHPGASFPVPTRLSSGKCGSICEGRGKPRMISTAFDPAFLSQRKGVPARHKRIIWAKMAFWLVRAKRTRFCLKVEIRIKLDVDAIFFDMWQRRPFFARRHAPLVGDGRQILWGLSNDKRIKYCYNVDNSLLILE